MTDSASRRRGWKRILSGGLLVVLLLLVANWVLASWLLWAAYSRVTASLRAPAEYLARGRTTILLEEISAGSGKSRTVAKVDAWGQARDFFLRVEHDANVYEISRAEQTRLYRAKADRPREGKKPQGVLYACGRTNFAETQRALKESVGALPRPSLVEAVALATWLHPLITGISRDDGVWQWRLWFRGGTARIGVSGSSCVGSFTEPKGGKRWNFVFRSYPEGTSNVPPATPASAEIVTIPCDELDRSLASAVRILALQWQAVVKEADGLKREGKGWLEVKDGRRVLHLKGTAREIGYQHGRLLAPNVKRLAERILYGVGLAYSLEKGKWFLREAEKLVERQRPHIPAEYFEEMQGLAEGAGVPAAVVYAANIFPEFFHCSGAALFGKATKGGALLHARVLDYMIEVGLQDEAVVMAVERIGARRFVNVSYAGFIGSVTGMNEKQVAIGEMGGRGEGLWDGTPMSLLVRGVLENCDTLEQALDYMRARKRTCEYYYVISDGKSKAARGIAATPDKFEVIGPGQYDPRLPEPVEDAVLLSAGDRYKELVKRVRQEYGRIGPEELMRIIARPVAMKSNLHDVIFEPERLRLWVANADRRRPACDCPYALYEWGDLFRAQP